MAQLTTDQIRELLDRNVSMSEIQAIARKRGDTVPGPTILGTIAQPFVRSAVQFGQALGTGITQLLGRESEQDVGSSVFRAPGFGTIPIPKQQPITSKRGQQQIIGETLETAGIFTPVGRVASAVKPLVGKTAGFATGLGLSGYGIESGLKLQEGAESPYSPGLGTAIPASIPILGKILSKTPSVVRFGAAKASGLTPDEIATIVTKPNEFTAARAQALDRISLGNMIEERFKTIRKDLSEIGQAYDPIRRTETPVKLSVSPFERILTKNKISIQDGRLVLSKESPPLSTSDISALERVMTQFDGPELSPNAYLNLRAALDDLAKWQKDPSRTRFSEDIFRELRRNYDDVAKVQIKGLKEADEAYAPVKKELESLKKDFIEFKDGKWVLKDAAISKISNATNKGREQLLARVEKYVPGISQQIQLVRTLEGIQAASGNRVGAYAQSLLLGGGLFAAGANPAFALIALAMSMPEIMVPILVKFGQLRGIAEKTLRSLVGKLVAGKTLTEQELLLYKNAILEHLNKVSPGDQFFDTPLGQRAFGLVKDLKPGLVIEDVSGIPKELAPLAQEARKYKSAEEFVKGKWTKLYHGSPVADVIRKEGFKLLPPNERRMASAYGDGIYFTTKKSGAYANTPDQLIEAYIPNDLKLFDAYDRDAGMLKTKELIAQGYDGVSVNLPSGEKHLTVFDPSKIKFRSQLTDLWNKVHGGTDDVVKTGLREGQPPIGSDWNEATQTRINLDETVARERFDIPNLEKVSFGGSDRDVYKLNDNQVLKVAKTSRGLEQNRYSTDFYAEDVGLIPKTIESGQNYVVKEFVGAPDANTKKMVQELKELSLTNSFYARESYYREVQKAVEIMNKYGYPGDELLNYGGVLWGDVQAVRNWGTKDGKPIMLDEGTLNGSLISNQLKQFGTKNLNDPLFREVWEKSREAKKKFGDLDTKTMYGAGAGLGALPLLDQEDTNK